MTLNSLLGSFDSLWHYGLITDNPSPPPNLSRSPLRPLQLTDHNSLSCPLASLLSLFSVMDEDGDGRLSVCEIRSLLAKLRMNSQSVHQLESFIQHTPRRTHMDDGVSLDFPQFTQLYASLFGAQQDCSIQGPVLLIDNDACFDDELLDAFRVYDSNGDGFISAAELAAVLLQLGLLSDDHCGINANLRRCQAYIDSADLDGDGMLDFNEFKCMMTHNHLTR